MQLKKLASKIPVVRYLAKKFYLLLAHVRKFDGSASYWEARYACGGSSGDGSIGKLAEFKAEVLNEFVEQNSVTSVIEFGCGDGQQLFLANYKEYLGLDVSRKAIGLCKSKYMGDSRKSFLHIDEYDGSSAELAMSLDVIYHLVEDSVFESYMHDLFNASTRFVAIYSSNFVGGDKEFGPHIKHRKFSDWIRANKPEWVELAIRKNKYPYNEESMEGSFADFYFYCKK